jgi:hypothetical protein
VTDSGRRGPGPVGWFFGCLLIAMGALMALLCGGCTAMFWVASLSNSDLASAGPMLVLSGVLGGIPALGGVGLIIAGWAILRPRRVPMPPQVDETFR